MTNDNTDPLPSPLNHDKNNATDLHQIRGVEQTRRTRRESRKLEVLLCTNKNLIGKNNIMKTLTSYRTDNVKVCNSD